MLLSGSIAFAHTDPIVMIIDGQSVKKSEFEYFYQKNHLGNTVDSKSVKVFADGFVNYKLKVQAAKDAHLDTLPNIRRVLKRYDDVESCELMPDKGSVHVAHILLRLGQKAFYHEQEVVERRIDSIYQALCKGADFADLAKKCSDDKGSAVNGGTLAWFTKGQTVQAFEKENQKEIKEREKEINVHKNNKIDFKALNNDDIDGIEISVDVEETNLSVGNIDIYSDFKVLKKKKN